MKYKSERANIVILLRVYTLGLDRKPRVCVVLIDIAHRGNVERKLGKNFQVTGGECVYIRIDRCMNRDPTPYEQLR